MTGDDTSFPATLDRWTDAHWDEYRDRVADGEGSCSAIDTINRRLRRTAPRETNVSAEAPR